MPVVVFLEGRKPQLQIRRRPEEQLVQTFATDAANQPFNERMRRWDVGNCFDFVNVQNSQICLPLMRPIQRVVIGTEIFRNVCPIHVRIRCDDGCVL